MALLEKAAGQGHAHAMHTIGSIHEARKEHDHAVRWYTKGAEAGLPDAMYNLAVALDMGQGVAVPDYPAAADWYKRAAALGHGAAANNLGGMYTLGRGRGVIEDKHSTDVESPPPPPRGHGLISVRVLVLNDPPARRHA